MWQFRGFHKPALMHGSVNIHTHTDMFTMCMQAHVHACTDAQTCTHRHNQTHASRHFFTHTDNVGSYVAHEVFFGFIMIKCPFSSVFHNLFSLYLNYYYGTVHYCKAYKRTKSRFQCLFIYLIFVKYDKGSTMAFIKRDNF